MQRGDQCVSVFPEHPAVAEACVSKHCVAGLTVKRLLNRTADAVPSCLICPVGTSVIQVTATDADDPTYGNSARLVYSILQGQPYFSVEPQTGELGKKSSHLLC